MQLCITFSHRTNKWHNNVLCFWIFNSYYISAVQNLLKLLTSESKYVSESNIQTVHIFNSLQYKSGQYLPRMPMYSRRKIWWYVTWQHYQLYGHNAQPDISYNYSYYTDNLSTDMSECHEVVGIKVYIAAEFCDLMDDLIHCIWMNDMQNAANA